MKTLQDYIRGYGYVPILLVAEYRYNGVRYSLVKQEDYDSFYFMKDKEVVKKKYIPHDRFPKLAIDHLNDKKNQGIINAVHECDSYKSFVKFIKEETDQDYSL